MLCTKLRADEKGPGVALHLARHPHAAEAEAPPLHLLCTRSLKNFAVTKKKPKPLRLQPEKPKRKRQNLKPVKLSQTHGATHSAGFTFTSQKDCATRGDRRSWAGIAAVNSSCQVHWVPHRPTCQQWRFVLMGSRGTTPLFRVLREILTSHSEIVPRSKSQRVSKLVEFLSKKCAPWTGPMQPAARSPNTADRQQNKTKGSEFGIHWRQESVCYLVFFVSWLASLLVLLHAQHRRFLDVLAGPWPMDGLWELFLGIILANPCGYNVSLAVKSIQLLQHWPCFYHPLQWPLDVAGCNGRFPGAWPDLSESGNVTAQPFF